MGHGGGFRPIKFFRTYISTLSGPEVAEYLEELKKDSKEIKEDITKLVFHMPNLTWDDAWELAYDERKTIIEVVNEVNKERNKVNT